MWAFKFDAAGRYAVNFGLFTGVRFTSGWNNTPWGTSPAQWNLAFKALYAAAEPITGLEVQVGGLYIAKGESTELTTYDEDGYLMLYKGVKSDGKGGYESVASGTAWVNGEKVVGHIPASVGDVITMPRSEVSDDPNVACHAGLHAAARDYALGYARQGTMLTMRVDPADVVSVPADSAQQKMRVCRYEVVELDTEAFRSVLWTPHAEDILPEEEEDYDLDEDYEDEGPWSGVSSEHCALCEGDDDESDEDDGPTPGYVYIWL